MASVDNNRTVREKKSERKTQVQRRIEKAIADHFPGARLKDVGRAGAKGRIGAVMVWDRFRNMTQINRQEKLWSVLRSELSPEDQLRISLILTLTSKELDSIENG